MSRVLQHLAAHGVQFNSGAFTAAGVADTITAFATGGQANATVLAAQINRVTTVASSGDSVKLPAQSAFPAFGGQGPQTTAGIAVTVINSGANPLNVFPALGDTIDTLAVNLAVSLPVNGLTTFYCLTPGAWFTSLSAAYTFSNLTLTGLLFESAAGGLTANPAGVQGGLPLTSELNRITTAANASAPYSATTLMAAQPGLTILVINKGANPIQVFPASGDAIDNLAANASVTQMASSMVLYTCTTAGAWDTEGLGTGYAGSLQTLLYAPTLTAVGGGQGAATQMTGLINRFNTVAAQGNGGKLPASAPGLAVTVLNRGAFPMQVYGAGTDTINGIATATGVAQGVGTTATYICNVAGNWEVPITSLQSTAPQTISGATDAIPPHVGHTYVVNTAGVDAMTLAAPTAGTDDGIEITITSNTANAHTLTATGLLQTGSASVNLATFAAQKGAGLTLMAYQGKWNVLAAVGITFS